MRLARSSSHRDTVKDRRGADVAYTVEIGIELGQGVTAPLPITDMKES